MDERSRSSPQVDFVDDECSTDSGCSSGGSTGSAEVLSRRGSAERHCHYADDPPSKIISGSTRPRCRSASSGQDRLKQRLGSSLKPKSSRSWSPEEKSASCGRYRSHGGGILKSPSHSQSASDTPSSDSESLKRSSTARSLRKAFQSLKISTRLEQQPASGNLIGSPDKPGAAKKSQKRILRSPVAYTYVKGLSGLPTQRIPRNAV